MNAMEKSSIDNSLPIENIPSSSSLSHSSSNLQWAVAEIQNLKKSLTCPVCLDYFHQPITLACNHSFCQTCIQDAISVKSVCPICSAKISKKSCLQNILHIEEVILFGKLIIDLTENNLNNNDNNSISADHKGNVKSIDSNHSLELNQISMKNETSDQNLSLLHLPSSSFSSSTSSSSSSSSLNGTTVSVNIVYEIEEIVNVLPRTWAGINKPGGIAWVKSIHDDRTFHVKYIVGGNDYSVPFDFIEKYNDLHRTSRKSRPILIKEETKIIDSDYLSESGTKQKTSQTLPSTSMRSNSNSNNKSSISSSIRQQKVLVSTSLSVKEASALEVFASTFQNVKLSSRFDSTTTHVIVHVDENGILHQRTMKYLQGIVTGIWIVSSDWLFDSIHSSKLLNEKKYEVHSNSKAIIQKAPLRSRLRMKQIHLGKKFKLFHNIQVLVYGSFPSPLPPKSDLEYLLQYGGAIVYKAINEFEVMINTFTNDSNEGNEGYHVIVCAEDSSRKIFLESLLLYDSNKDELKEKEFIFVNPMWVIDSITNYNLMDFNLDCYRFT